MRTQGRDTYRGMWFFALVALPALVCADLLIKLEGGKTIEVPVDNETIESIQFVVKEEAETGSPVGPQNTHLLRVGSARDLEKPSDAARVAGDGDVIEIDAGIYKNDYAVWKSNNLTIRGVGGMAHLQSSGLIPNGKAIWIVNGDNTLIENVEFSGAAVAHTNGAGIRHQGGDLELRNTYFHDNENSILSGKLINSVIRVSSSRFWYQKRPNKYTHGIYIGQARRLELIGNHFKGTDLGHQVKSRALENHILYNRIEDVERGNSSRLIDLSNCGGSYIIGNDLHQAATTSNSDVIGFGPEGCLNRSDAQKRLFVVNNTLINHASGGSLVRNFADGNVLVANNLLVGAGEILVGEGRAEGNYRLDLNEWPMGSWLPAPTAASVDAAIDLSNIESSISLVPAREFQPTVGTQPRISRGRLDIGAREQPAP